MTPNPSVEATRNGILWLVLPSQLLSVTLPLLLRAGRGFWGSPASSCAVTAGAYLATVWMIGQAGIHV